VYNEGGWRSEKVDAITRVLDLGPIEVSSCGVNFVFVQIYYRVNFYAVEA
jgi:hypothetical protein